MTVSGALAKDFVRAWQRAAWARASGPSRFAQALLARHGQGVRPAPRLSLLLALRARTQHPSVLRPVGLTLNQISLTLRSATPHAESAAAPLGRGDTPLALAHRPASGRPPVAAAALALPLAPPEPAPVVRLLARARRSESQRKAPALKAQARPVSASPAPRALAPAQTRWPDELPTLRPRAVASAAASATMPTTPSESAAPAAAITRSAATQALAPHEIERITERVLGSLDRRILAERERHGRV